MCVFACCPGPCFLWEEDWSREVFLNPEKPRSRLLILCSLVVWIFSKHKPPRAKNKKVPVGQGNRGGRRLVVVL